MTFNVHPNNRLSTKYKRKKKSPLTFLKANQGVKMIKQSSSWVWNNFTLVLMKLGFLQKLFAAFLLPAFSPFQSSNSLGFLSTFCRLPLVFPFVSLAYFPNSLPRQSPLSIPFCGWCFLSACRCSLILSSQFFPFSFLLSPAKNPLCGCSSFFFYIHFQIS